MITLSEITLSNLNFTFRYLLICYNNYEKIKIKLLPDVCHRLPDIVGQLQLPQNLFRLFILMEKETKTLRNFKASLN
jgi:hypothetical protein